MIPPTVTVRFGDSINAGVSYGDRATPGADHRTDR